MPIAFDGVDDRIRLSTGACASLDGGPITVAAVVNLADTTDGGVIAAYQADNTRAWALVISGGTYFFAVGVIQALTSIPAGRHLIVATKDAGLVLSRAHKYVYSTNAWTHVNGNLTADSVAGPGAGGRIQFGLFDPFNEYLNGDIDVVGVWDRVLTDTECEQLPHSLTDWYASAPSGMWVLDQSVTSQTVIDQTGGGANETSRVGTTVSTNSALIGYGHPISVPQAVAAATNVSAEVATATGTADNATAAVAPSAVPTTAAGVANNATAAVAMASAVAPGAATAPNASAQVAANTSAASATATASNASAQATIGAGTASATATAPNASTQSATSAGTGSATAAGYNATVSIGASPGSATAAGAADNATADDGPDTNIAAQTALGVGAAYGATVVSQGRRNQMIDGPCNWEIDTGCCSMWDDLDPAIQEIAYHLSTLTLWAATGRRFGRCEITVQPCRQRRRLPLYQTFPVPGWGFGSNSGQAGFGVFMEGGRWFNGCFGGCRCRARCEVELDGPTTTDAIIEVRVAGEVVPPSAYQIQDGHLLVRIDGQCWPTCADYSQQNPPDFEIVYLRGDEQPNGLKVAAGILACEFAKACMEDDSCRLPSRLTSLTRQGVSVQVGQVTNYLDLGLTEISEVDRIIVALNPYRQQERSRVYSVDRPRPRMVT